MCYMEPDCVSINFGPLERGKHKCELNNATDDKQFVSLLQSEPTFTYLAIEVICHASFEYCAIEMCKVTVLQIKLLVFSKGRSDLPIKRQFFFCRFVFLLTESL